MKIKQIIRIWWINWNISTFTNRATKIYIFKGKIKDDKKYSRQKYKRIIMPIPTEKNHNFNFINVHYDKKWQSITLLCQFFSPICWVGGSRAYISVYCVGLLS